MRLIDADAVIRQIGQLQYGKMSHDELSMLFHICDMINDAPTIDAEPVRHGRWIKSKTEKLYFGYGMGGYYDYPELCSRCHYDATEYGYGVGNCCPNCGAKMDTKEENV